jgi:hypothetical protein
MVAGIAAHHDDAAAHSCRFSCKRRANMVAGIARNLQRTAAHARRGPRAGIADDTQGAARHQPPRLVADIALDDDPAVAHAMADVVEPVARLLDADMIGVAHAQAERVADDDACARSLHFDAFDLGGAFAGNQMRHQRRQIEPLLGALAQREHERLHGSNSLRWKWCGPSLPP